MAEKTFPTRPYGIIARNIKVGLQNGMTEQELDSYLAENNTTFDEIQDYVKKAGMPDDAKIQDLLERERNGEWADFVAKQTAPKSGTDKALEAIDAFVGSVGNAATLGLPDALGALSDKIVGTATGEDVSKSGYIANRNRVKAEHPTASLAGEITGYVVPVGAVARGASLGVKAAGNMAAKAGAGKIGTTAAKALGLAVGSEAAIAAQRFNERAAGTRAWVDELDAGSEFLEGTAWNLAFQAALGGAGRFIRPIFSANERAIRAVGGRENLRVMQENYSAAIKAGKTTEEAMGASIAALSEKVSPQEAANVALMMKRNAKFASFMGSQLASGQQNVADTVSTMTRAEANKASDTILKNTFNSQAYKNTFGTSEVDLSKKGLRQSFGIGTEKYNKARAEGLLNAEEKVMGSAELADAVRTEFKRLSSDLMTNGSQDLNYAIKQVEAGTIKSFESSGAMQEALESAQKQIQQAAQAAQQSGEKLSPAVAKQIEMKAMKEGAEKHLWKIMSEGTDSVQDIDDIRAFFKDIAARDVMQGRGTALGSFNEGVNSRILDRLDQNLYKTNQAARALDPLEKAWDLGNKVDNFNVNEIEAFLDSTTSAANKASKLAALKQGFYARFAKAAIDGNTVELNKLRAMLRSSESIGRYISPKEFGEMYARTIKGKAEAASTMKAILTGGNKAAAESGGMAKEAVQAVVYAALNAPVALFTTMFKMISGTYYGSRTASKLQKIIENGGNWSDFNKLWTNTKDLLEQNQMKKTAKWALNAMSTAETSGMASAQQVGAALTREEPMEE